MSRTRRQQVAEEKGPYQDHSTSGELCKFLGVSPRLFRRRLSAGDYPPAAQRTTNGWGLWSPEQRQSMLATELEKKR